MARASEDMPGEIIGVELDITSDESVAAAKAFVERDIDPDKCECEPYLLWSPSSSSLGRSNSVDGSYGISLQ